MGAGGLVWVRYGARSMGVHKNNACRDENGRAGPGLGPMAREISPNIMFCKKKNKRGADGSGWVHMGSHGCSGVHLHGGTGKQGETGQKSVVRTCFAVVTQREHTTSTSTMRSYHEHEHNASTSRSRAQHDHIMSTSSTRTQHKHEHNERKQQTQAQREHTTSTSTSTT